MEWTVARRCRPGEATCGDLAVVEARGDSTLVAGIDGIGHGTAAERAAQRAAAVVRRDAGQDLVALARRCHQALRGTRGAALSLASLSGLSAELTWLGIGNVEARVIDGEQPAPSPRNSLVLVPGVAGHEPPPVSPETVPVRPGDILILATDGVRSTFADSLDISGSTQAISERVLSDHWQRPDDALVIAIRYLGRRT